MEYPAITVVITTLDRVELLRETIRLLKQNLLYPSPIHYVIGNDGAIGPLADMLIEEGWQDVVTVGDGERHGLGANTNRALGAVHTDIVLQSQDDYHLVKPLDLREHVQTLIEDDTAGWIRLRLTAGQNFTATVKDRYWRVSWFSDTLYICSDQPHLKSLNRWHGYYGMYQEGVDLPMTENEWCWRCKDIGQRGERQLEVLIPVDWPADSSWLHMGDEISWKRFGF